MPAPDLFNFRSLDELRRRISELGLALGTTEDIRLLSEPTRAGGFSLPNRLVVLPMEGCDAESDGSPGELTFRRYHRFAAGGAGLLWFEATAVVPEGRANPRQLWLQAANTPAFARLADEARRRAADRCGASHRPILVLQLTHSGRYSRPGRVPAPIIAHHSPLLDPQHQLPPDYPLITDAELERLEDRYVEAARCAQRAGFDAVDIKACHRYLVSELLASHTRPGRYGGSFENRSRFLRNVVARIRASVPGLCVTVRLNAFDAMAYPYGFGMHPEDPTRPDLTEPVELVRYLQAQGAPLVNITIGNPYFNPHINRPFDRPTAGAPSPPETPLVGVARFANIVRQVQSAFPDLAVIGGGYSWLRQFFPNVAAAHVRDKWVSLVGLGRMAFAYPDFAHDLKSHGRLDSRKVCIACSACTQIMRDGGRTGCVPRDAAVYGPIYRNGRAQAQDTIRELARTCHQCIDPTCVSECPAQVDIPKFVNQIAAGEFRAAYETLRQANVLAAVCGYICPSETQCEAGCLNQHYSTAVPIRRLQRWVAEKAIAEGWTAAPRSPAPASGKKVAVLGAGAAGISACIQLASLGHSVVLFESAVAPGGLIQGTIPPERMPIAVVDREIRDALAAAGTAISQRQVRIGPACNLNCVINEGFDAVLVALGLSKSGLLNSSPRPKTGVEGALEFLQRTKNGGSVSDSVLVLGGGNTAIDAALAAQHAGAREVAVVYRRSFAEMPAWPEERDKAIHAGVYLLTLTAPVGYELNGTGGVTGVRVVRTNLPKVGLDGRRLPQPIPGTEHVLPTQLVIEAFGQRVDDELKIALPGLRFTEHDLIWVQPETMETSRQGVFAAGDIVNGGTTVVRAVAEGMRAARSIDQFLQARPGS